MKNQKLLLHIELFDQSVVTLLVLALEIFQMSAAVCDHLQKAPSAVLVFEVFLQMHRKLVYLLGKQGNLDLRATGVLIMNSHFFGCFSLFLLGKHGSMYSISSYFTQYPLYCVNTQKEKRPGVYRAAAVAFFVQEKVWSP